MASSLPLSSDPQSLYRTRPLSLRRVVGNVIGRDAGGGPNSGAKEASRLMTCPCPETGRSISSASWVLLPAQPSTWSTFALQSTAAVCPLPQSPGWEGTHEDVATVARKKIRNENRNRHDMREGKQKWGRAAPPPKKKAGGENSLKGVGKETLNFCPPSTLLGSLASACKLD